MEKKNADVITAISLGVENIYYISGETEDVTTMYRKTFYTIDELASCGLLYERPEVSQIPHYVHYYGWKKRANFAWLWKPLYEEI